MHSLGVLTNAYFDDYDAFSSAARCRCAKSCARVLIGMLVHESAVDTVVIENDNLRKVCADFLNAAAAATALLYHRLLTSSPLGCLLTLAGMSAYRVRAWR